MVGIDIAGSVDIAVVPPEPWLLRLSEHVILRQNVPLYDVYPDLSEVVHGIADEV
ncbi:MAG: hypothetical protein ACLQRH_11850 [Acidimicrobiales bacterium]